MRAGSLNWGLILIIIGLVALGWTMGRLPSDAVIRLLELWPILLIALGIQMIFSRSKIAGMAYLSSLIIVVAAIIAIAPYWDQVKSGEGISRESGDIEAVIKSQINTVEINADFSRRDFTLDDYDGQGIKLRYDHEILSPRLNYVEKEGTGTLNLMRSGYRWLKFFGKSELPRWKLMLTRDFPLDLDLKSNKGYCYLRMADLNINSLKLDCRDCYDVVLQFGDRIPKTPIMLDLDDSKLRLEVPREFNIRLVDGKRLPFHLTERLDYYELGDDLVADTSIVEDSILTLDIAPGLRELIINRN